MSKTTVWKSLNSNQKDTRPMAAKKARPYPLFPHPCHLEMFLLHSVVSHFFCAFQLLCQLVIAKMRAAKLCSVLC